MQLLPTIEYQNTNCIQHTNFAMSSPALASNFAEEGEVLLLSGHSVAEQEGKLSTQGEQDRGPLSSAAPAPSKCAGRRPSYLNIEILPPPAHREGQPCQIRTSCLGTSLCLKGTERQYRETGNRQSANKTPGNCKTKQSPKYV